jgi:signal recognition particle GTPase
MGEGNKNGNKSGNKSDIREEIERLREVLAALDLGVEAANAALDRLQAKVEPEQQQRRGDETDEIKKGSKVKILSRNKEVWTTGQYVGQVAKVLRITPRCVWLKIPGRVDELRRNKEFVKLVKPNH